MPLCLVFVSIQFARWCGAALLRWAGVFPPVVEKRVGGMAAAAPKRQQGDIVWAKYGRM